MVCREAQVGSAVTSYVTQTTTLAEQQVLSLYHEVMRDGRDAPTPSAAQQAAVIDNLSQSVERDATMTPARRRSILARLTRARDEQMNGQRFYSTSRLVERAQAAERALDDYVSDTARQLGVPVAQVRADMADLRQRAEQDRTLAPSRGWVNAQRDDATYAGLPLDRQTAFAIETLNARARLRAAAARQRPTVNRVPVNSSAVSEIGWDQETGRCEVVLRSNPNAVLAYRMTPEQFHAFSTADSIGNHYATRVRGNPEYRYQSTDEAEAEATQTQCATCGQFAGTTHSCPPRDSTEERNRTERLARQAARRSANPAPTTPEPAEPERLGGAQRRYHGESGSFRTTNLSTVQHRARRNQAVVVPVAAAISTVSRAQGPVADRGAVTGTATVTYNGRGRGYSVTANTSAGDSGNDRLRCNCPEYQRNYDCVHVRQVVQDLATRLNQDSIRARHGLGPALEQVGADLAQDHAESVAAQQAARAEDRTSPVSYTDDVEAFQRDYKAAKDRLAAGEAPVAYMTENATDGLGARGTGRAFGVELEFDIEAGRDRSTVLRNIGRELHAAGLTRSASQGHYHQSERNGYTENHNGGWSFESDCTVAGEIVSPIMYDEPETWQNLAKVCEIVKRNGGTITTRTGSHVHISAHNYDHTVENHNRLLGAFAENEDVLYRLASEPNRGRHRGMQWSSPNRIPASGYATVSQARQGNNSHHLGLNLQSVSGSQSDHVEFRIYDGTLDESVIQTQIKMSLALTESAFRDRDYQPGAHQPVGAHRAHNRSTHGASRRLTGEAWHQDTAGFRALADRLFRRPEDKAQLASLFAVTRWQRSGGR